MPSEIANEDHFGIVPLTIRQMAISLPKPGPLRHFHSPASSGAQTFDTITSDGGEATPHHQIVIIAVLGIKGSKTIFHQEFNQWKHNLKMKGASVKFVRFNMSDVSKMSENSMDDNCDKLAQYMTELEMSRSIFRPGSSEHKKNPASETQGSKASDHTGKVRKFILVGHVLGCWIVRHLVWKYQNETIVVNTIATVFVDDDSMQSRQIDQCRYLRNARRIFSLKLKSDDNINTVATTLHLINGEFREALRTLKDSASTTIKTWSCKVWLSENSQEQSEQPGEEFRRRVKAVWRRSGRLETNSEVADRFQRFEREIDDFLQEARNRRDDSNKEDDLLRPSKPPVSGLTTLADLLPRNISVTSLRSGSLSDITSPPVSLRASFIERPAQTQSQIADTVKLAGEWIESGDFRRADRVLQEVEEDQAGPGKVSNPHQDTDYRAYQVRVLRLINRMYLGEYRIAVDGFRQLVDNITTYPELKQDAWRWLGSSQTLQGDYSDAVTTFEKLLDAMAKGTHLAEDKVRTQQELALAYACLGQLRKAHELMHLTQITMAENIEGRGRRVQTGDRNVYDSISLTKATIDLIRGDYRGGLANAGKAFHGMKHHLGRRHLKTLETAKLRALFLALNSRSSEAEAACRETLDSMQLELGQTHPETLETMSILVFIFRTQARLKEAVIMGQRVCNFMNDLAKDHLKTLDARAELATNYRSVGDYVRAGDELQDVIRLSKNRYSWHHPSTLRYLSELAHVYLCCGYFELAEDLALKVLKHQHDAYSFSVRDKQPPLSLLPHSQMKIPELLPSEAIVSHARSGAQNIVEPIVKEIDFEFELATFIGELKRRDDLGKVPIAVPPRLQTMFDGDLEVCSLLSEATMDQGLKPAPSGQAKEMMIYELHRKFSRLRVHPFLLQTLQVIACIVCQKPVPEVKLGQKILNVVIQWRELTLTPSNHLTLAARFELAAAEREGQDLESAKTRFYGVYADRLQILGKSHPDTLSVKRELLVTICASGSWNDKFEVSGELDVAMLSDEGNDDNQNPVTSAQEPQNPPPRIFKIIESYSKEILLFQEERLGLYHPETLKTLMWVFVIQLNSQGDQSQGEQSQAVATAGIALERLREKSVRRQRYIECVSMEEKIAFFYKEYGNFEAEEDIRRTLRDEQHDVTQVAKQYYAEFIDGLSHD